MNVNNITQQPVANPYKNNNGAPKTTRIRALYANDLHSHIDGFSKLKTETDKFRAENAAKKQDGMIVIGGDSYVGGNEPRNKLVMSILNMIMPDANVFGNHEFDWKGTLGLSERTDSSKFKTLALNLKMKPGCALEDDVQAGRLAKSTIVEKNGEKFGLIGLIPSDLFLRISQETKDYSKDIEVMNLKDTINAVQEEVHKLEKQGINKISVVSHMGYDADVEMAKNLEGVDVIHGAHSHDTLPELKPGVNLFTSKRGEPVIITQAGKNGHKFGILDVVYDEKGKIIQAKNEIKSLSETPENLLVKMAQSIIEGKPQVIGTFANDCKTMPESALEENPISSFIADSFKKFMKTDIILSNAGSIRASIKKGPVTDEQIKDMMPYFNEMHIYKFSEKEIIETLNNAIAATRKYNRTGAIQVAGIEYTIGKNDKVKDVYLRKDDGTKVPIDSNNPRADKFYTVGYNTYLYGGSEGVENLHAPDKRIKKFEMNETELIINYIKSFNGQPIKVAKDGRIKVEQ